MKQLYILIISITLFSCTKENDSIVGEWNIKSFSTVGSNQNFSNKEIILRFKSNGEFNIINNIQGHLHQLEGFNKFRMKDQHTIEFSNSNSNETFDVGFNLYDNLLLNYPARCPMTEDYIRNR